MIWMGVGSSLYYNTVQSIGLCHTIPVKTPVEVNNKGMFCTISLASQANAVSFFRAQAAQVLRLPQTALRKTREEGDIFSLKQQTSFGCSMK